MDRANTPLSAIGQFNFASEFMSYFELFASAVNSSDFSHVYGRTEAW